MRRDGAELPGETLLRDAEHGHPDQAAGGQADTEPARLGLLAGDQLVQRLDRDRGREQEELHRDELLCTPLRPFRMQSSACEAPVWLWAVP